MVPGILDTPSATSTAALTHQPPSDPTPSSDQVLLNALSASPDTFLQAPPSLHTAALVLAKRYLDPLAASVSETQEQRLQEARRKRKRGDDDVGSRKVLRMKQVHLEGFEIEQVWEQARRILDANWEEVEACLKDLAVDGRKDEMGKVSGDGELVEEKPIKMVRFDEDGFEVGSELEEDKIHGADEGLSEDVDGTDRDGLEGDELDDDVEHDEDGEDIEADDSNLDVDDGLEEADAEVFVPDKNGLNDGFFSIDDFNRTSQFLEQQDARGDQDDEAVSDDEEIDWDADPLGQSVPLTNGHRKATANDAEDFSSEEDGPTFGNADLNAPDTSDDDDSDASMPIEDTTLSNTNDIKYADFFAPPPRALTKSSKRQRPLPKTQPPPSAPTEDDIQRTISAVRRDIFEDDQSQNSGDDAKATDSTNPNSRLSTHEKRQRALAAQIRALEAASIAKRDWTLSGEARAAERPINSLLEEDLDFERAGKPVPVITAEVSEDIEALIKRRIVAREFDEVVKRRPDSIPLGGAEARRGRFELEDTKDSRGLAEIYEEEHLKNVDPAGHVDKRDAILKKEHAEIERLWREVAGKLDALSSWHYRPKPAEVTVGVVSDVPAVRMEDARPSGVGGVGDVGGGESRLAPQEVFRVGEERERGEVIGGEGVVAREELSREQKLRRRRREKERMRKAGIGKLDGKGVEREREREREGVVAELKRGGVRVIGKKGEIRNVEGKMVKGGGGVKGGGRFKL